VKTKLTQTDAKRRKMSRVECKIPLRNFLGSGYGLDVARSCGHMRIAWVLGACTVVSLGLLYSHYVTKRQEAQYVADPVGRQPTIVVPLWLALIPLFYAIYTYLTAVNSAETYWKTEELHFNTAEMNKKEYITHRAGDDRLGRSSGVSIANTAAIASSALFGPLLRGDSR
jgi:hypothetical protein